MRINQTLFAVAAAVAVTLLASPPAHAQTAATALAPGRAAVTEPWPAKDGGEVYETLCQGCHMPQGKGAVGGGAYPALASNKNLASATYISYTVVNGRKGMPQFGTMLTDTQVADVVNYVRSHFGNAYADTISAADVKATRPAPVAAASGR